MTPIVIETDIEPRDWRELRSYVYQRGASSNFLLQGHVPFLLVLVAASFVVALIFRLFHRDLDFTTAFWTLIVCFVSMMLLQWFFARRMQPDRNGMLLGPVHLEIDETGIRSTRPGYTSFTEWNRVQQIDERATCIFLPIDRVSAYIIPKRSLDAESTAAIIEQMRRWHAERTQAPLAAHEQSPGWPPPTAPAAATSPIAPATQAAQAPSSADADTDLRAAPSRAGFWWQLRQNLLAGLKLFGLRRISPTLFTPTFDHVIALLAIGLLTAFAFDWLRSDSDAEFGFYGLYAWAYYLLGGFWACALVARMQTPQANTRALLVAWLALAPYVIATIWLIYRLPFAQSRPLIAAGIAGGIVVGLSLRAVRVVFGYVRPGIFALVVVAVLGLPAFLGYLGIDETLWASPESQESADNDDDWSASEFMLFDEPARVAAAVEDTAPQRPGITDTYFVGFAGHGEQRVFRREALFGEKVFARRFGTGERSVELINDTTDRDTYPLATVSGLRYALNLIGRRMDRDNDVLVLLVTSHASQEEGISVTNGTLPLAQLSPADLRDALDDSGIKWRVVIVSACYAGAFLDPLKSDSTLVITAADAEHNSFGCADDRDLTYFGEAFLRDTLPGSPSLEAAFLKARTLIDERENAENLEHSNPQIFIGSAIRAKLATLTAPVAPRNTSSPIISPSAIHQK
jgi:hypothetical protein